jgi:hypothetical protein
LFRALTGNDSQLIEEDSIYDLLADITGYCLYQGRHPFLGSLKDLESLVTMNEYLRGRDRVSRHTDDTNPHHWVGATYQLAAGICKCGHKGIGQYCARQRFMFDKKLTGANTHHYRMEDALQCRFCPLPDTLSHQIMECRQQDVVDCRDTAIANFCEASQKMAQKDKMLAKAADMYLALLRGASSGLAWLGMWFADQADMVKAAIDSCMLNKHQYNMLHKTIVKLGHDSWRMAAAHELARAKREEDDEYATRMEPNGNREFYFANAHGINEGVIKRARFRNRRARRQKALELIGEDEYERILKRKKGDEGAKCAAEVEMYKDIMGAAPFSDSLLSPTAKAGSSGSHTSTSGVSGRALALLKRPLTFSINSLPVAKRMGSLPSVAIQDDSSDNTSMDGVSGMETSLLKRPFAWSSTSLPVVKRRRKKKER